MEILRSSKLYLVLAGMLLAMLGLLGHAQIVVDITGGAVQRLPVTVLHFKGESQLPKSLSNVVRSDLRLSGLFSLVELEGVEVSEVDLEQELPFDKWRFWGADALLIGEVQEAADPQSSERWIVRFRLYDVVKRLNIAEAAIEFSDGQLRATGHKIADTVFESLQGVKGIFSAKIAYVLHQNKRFYLRVSDFDGGNATTVFESLYPILSPSWSPSGHELAFVLVGKVRPVVHILDLISRRRWVLANFSGTNSAPAWSPDGKSLAIVLGRGGSSQIYHISKFGQNLRQLTRSQAIDTEPVFSKDGRWIYFTSDRGGVPQVYKIAVEGGQRAERVTFSNRYSVSPQVNEEEDLLVYVTKHEDQYNVVVQDMKTGQSQRLTDGALDESPSLSSNGKMVLYAARAGGRGVLAAVSSDGAIRQVLSSSSGDIREPVWGPLR